MISSLKPRQSCKPCAADSRRTQPVRAAWRIIANAPCFAGPPRLRLIEVFRCARRSGSFHWTFIIEHSLSNRGREASCTLTARHRAVNSTRAVFRSARTCAMTCPARRHDMQLYISVCSCPRQAFSRSNTSNAVYLRRGLLFDSKIKQLRINSLAHARATASNAVPVMVRATAGAQIASEARGLGSARGRLPRLTSPTARDIRAALCDRAWTFGLWDQAVRRGARRGNEGRRNCMRLAQNGP
jgi:hypothetical protein